MKHILTMVFLLLLILNLNAQVKIGGNPVAPVSSAVLELDGGNNRGLLLPRMRKMDIVAIINPAEGLTIYATDEQVMYLRRSGNWVKVSSNADAFSLPYSNHFNYDGTLLELTNFFSNGVCIQALAQSDGYGVRGATTIGTGINGIATQSTGVAGYFINNGGGRSLISMNKTGIGTENPVGLLHVDAMNTTADAMIINDQSPTLQLQSAGIDKGYIQTSGNDFRLGTNAANTSGSIIMRTKGIDRVKIDSTGKMNIGSGTYSPGMLNVLGGGICIEDGTSPSLKFINGSEPTFSLYQQGNDFVNFHSPTNGFQFSIGNSTFFRLKPTTGAANFTNRVGISMDNPLALLHINGFDSNVSAVLIDDYDPIIQLQNNSVNKAYFQVDGNDIAIATNSSNTSGKVILRTNNIDRLLVDNAGNVSIGGTPPPPGYKLAVKGKVAATDFDVVATGSWPDYVFDPSYKLKSLEETEAFIKANKHLPNIPAAAIVEKEGYGLGDMQKRMMEKIEELTLYLIESKKELNTYRTEANKEIVQLKQQVQILQSKK